VIEAAPIVNGVCFRAEGKVPFQLPTVSLGTPTLSVTSPQDHLDLAQLERLHRRGRTALQQLEPVAYWWARGVEESDEWKRFVFQFVALEVLANRFAKTARKVVIPRLRHLAMGELSGLPVPLVARADQDVTGKFALVASLLAPSEAVEDTHEFQRLKRVRDGIAHGGVEVGTALPSPDRLLRRYLQLALEFVVESPTE
jgi:hypothetical protein